MQTKFTFNLIDSTNVRNASFTKQLNPYSSVLNLWHIRHSFCVYSFLMKHPPNKSTPILLVNTTMKKQCYLVILFISFLNQPLHAAENILVARNMPVNGHLQSDYVNSWWQWAVSMPNRDSPVRDRTGVNCSVNQHGAVWYLAGGYGSSLIHRKCTVPSGKYLFFPVINMLYSPSNSSNATTCASVKKNASINNQYLISFKVVVDKHKFVNPVYYRQASKECFDLSARIPRKKNVPRIYPSATDGYWIMIKPLSIGSHKISFRAEYNNPNSAYGKMIQDIQYDLKILKP